MNMIIFTPGLQASAIGRMTGLVTRALVEGGHTVTVVRSEDPALLEQAAHDFGPGVHLLSWTSTDQVYSLIKQADVIVYQIGDQYAFHQGGLHWLKRAPGIVCLHDFFLGNLFYGWSQERREEAFAVLCRWYGETVAEGYFNHSSSESFISGTKDCAPMTEWVCSQALSVIAHSRWGIQRVLDACPGPVRIVPLAYDAPGARTAKAASSPADKDGKKFVLLTIGHVNPNKRAESVIRAMGRSNVLREKGQYRLVGKIESDVAEKLAALARDQKVELVVVGEASAELLAQEIAQADAICCLRWPTIEGASASAIEAMLYGKPVIVTDAGFYAELPNRCVRKIGVSTEIEDLVQVLESLASHPAQREALGLEAASWASITFSPGNYARQVLEMALSTQRAALLIDTMHTFTGLLASWGGMQALMSLNHTIKPLEIFNAPLRVQ